MIGTIVQLLLLFGGLSLLAFGGGTGVLPDMQRASVDIHHWVSAREFLDFFAISRAAPGPGSLIVVLIGQKAAGFPGAIAGFIAMFGPSSVLAYLGALFFRRTGQAPGRALLERALAPVAIGLTLASGLALLRATEHGWATYAVSGIATISFACTEIHPLLLLAAGAVTVIIAGT